MKLSDMIAYEWDPKHERAIETYEYQINGQQLVETSVRPSPLPIPSGVALRTKYDNDLKFWLRTQTR